MMFHAGRSLMAAAAGAAFRTTRSAVAAAPAAASASAAPRSGRRLFSTNNKAGGNAALFEAEAAAGAEAEAGAADTPVNRALNTAALTLTASACIAGGALVWAQYNYEIPQLAKLTAEVQRELAKQGTNPDLMLKWKAQAMEQYLELREWGDKQYHHYADPSHDVLLPDLPPGMGHIRTLVLDLEDLLIGADWTRERGWRVFKRPGVDVFLQHLSQRFEVVVFTSASQHYAQPILERLDSNHCIHYSLYKDATQYVHGEHVRDLSKLNRPLTHVLYLSAHEPSFQLQPSNAILVPAWNRDPSDRALTDLMPFLETIARQCPPDVRDVVKSYTEESAVSGEDIPSIFRKRMEGLKQQRTQRQQQMLSGWGPGARK